VTTDCSPHSFKPANLNLKSGQGLVFNAGAIWVIRLKLDKPEDGGCKPKPLARWVSQDQGEGGAAALGGAWRGRARRSRHTPAAASGPSSPRVHFR